MNITVSISSINIDDLDPANDKGLAFSAAFEVMKLIVGHLPIIRPIYYRNLVRQGVAELMEGGGR